MPVEQDVGASGRCGFELTSADDARRKGSCRFCNNPRYSEHDSARMVAIAALPSQSDPALYTQPAEPQERRPADRQPQAQTDDDEFSVLGALFLFWTAMKLGT